MNKRLEYGLVLLAVHVVLSLIALASYDPAVPNSDIGGIFLPNMIPMFFLMPFLPNFGYWSPFLWAAGLWFVVGYFSGPWIAKALREESKPF